MTLRSILLSFLLLLVLLLASLPFTGSWASHYFFTQYLEQQGLNNIDIEQVWVNPYTGLASLKGIRFQDSEQKNYQLEQLKIDVALFPLTQQRIHIEAVELFNADLIVKQNADQTLIINGITLPQKNKDADAIEEKTPSTSSDSLWQIVIDQILIKDFRLQALTPEFKGQTIIKQFSVTGINTESNQAAQLNADLNVLELATADHTASLQLKLKSPLRVKQADQNQWHVEAKPEITISDNQLTIPGYQLALSTLNIDLETQVRILENLSYHVDGSIGLNQLNINDGQQNLVDIQSLVLNTAFNGQVLAIDNLKIQELTLLSSTDKRYPTLLTDAEINIDKTAITLPTETTPASVMVDQVRVNRANLQIVRDGQGELPQLTVLAQEEKSETTNRAVIQEETSTPPQVTIHSLVMTPEVKVFFEDQSLNPVFSEKIQFEEFKLVNLKPLDKSAITDVKAALGLKHGAKLSAQGTININTLDTDMEITISDYQLLGLSGYSQNITGYALETGTLNLNTQASIVEEQLNLENIILIDQLNLRAANQDKTVQYANQLTMPLDKALDLLRNKKNEIKLKVPVTGLLSDPNVDLQQVINKAVANAMKKASISFLKNMLQPYSSIISIARIANKELTKIQLDTVPFDIGQFSLNEKGSDYANKIAQLLEEKPSLKLKLCGVTTPEDQLALQAASNKETTTKETTQQTQKANNTTSQLQSLAEQRSSVLREFLIKQQNVKEAQLLICLPIHETEPDKVSGVALSI